MEESLIYSLEEKLRFIEESNSMEELPPSVLPPSHKESYYFVSYSQRRTGAFRYHDVTFAQPCGVHLVDFLIRHAESMIQRSMGRVLKSVYYRIFNHNNPYIVKL